MRIILLGSGSFIARAVIEACKARGMETVRLRHGDALGDVLTSGDCLINFSIDPRYRSGAYDEAFDCDLRAARIAATAGAHFVMLSTRRVYGEKGRWGAVETDAAQGDETAYGRNKAVSERAVIQACGEKVGIFRLSNIFGYEYNHPVPRRSFLGQLLHNLKHREKILFDMRPETRRDFLPVEICASLLAARAAEMTQGTFNLGSGFAIPCGDLARLVMAGYGTGELVYEAMTVEDSFFLTMDKWRSHFDLPVDEKMVRDYCFELGRRLKCEKS